MHARAQTYTQPLCHTRMNTQTHSHACIIAGTIISTHRTYTLHGQHPLLAFSTFLQPLGDKTFISHLGRCKEERGQVTL